MSRLSFQLGEKVVPFIFWPLCWVLMLIWFSKGQHLTSSNVSPYFNRICRPYPVRTVCSGILGRIHLHRIPTKKISALRLYCSLFSIVLLSYDSRSTLIRKEGGNSRNHAYYLSHTAKNSAQKHSVLHWRVDDPFLDQMFSCGPVILESICYGMRK